MKPFMVHLLGLVTADIIKLALLSFPQKPAASLSYKTSRTAYTNPDTVHKDSAMEIHFRECQAASKLQNHILSFKMSMAVGSQTSLSIHGVF